MRQRQTFKQTDRARSRKHLFTLGGVGLLLAVAGGSSVAMAVHNSAGSQPTSGLNYSATKVETTNKQAAKSGDASRIAGQQLPSATTDSSIDNSYMTSPDVTSPSVTNTNSSSTTITVNGQTTHVTGTGSYDKSYVSDDGTTHVDISVHGSLVSNGNEVKEDAMD